MRRLAIPLVLATGLLTANARSPVERKANQEVARTPSQDKPAPTQLGEVNVAPLKDVLTVLSVPYQAHGFSVLIGFRVEADGSLSNIRIISPSGSKIMDSKALEILSNIGESHILGPLSDLSSATLSLQGLDDSATAQIRGIRSNS